MNAFTGFARGGLPHNGGYGAVLRLARGLPGVRAAMLLGEHPQGGMEVIEAQPEHGLVGQRISDEVCVAIAEGGRSTAGLRLPARFARTDGRRPGWIAGAPVRGTGSFLMLLGNDDLAGIQPQLAAAAEALASLAGGGEQTGRDQRAAARVDSIVRNLPVPFVFVDENGSGVFINDGARQLLSLGRSETSADRVATALGKLIATQPNVALRVEMARDPRASACFYVKHGTSVHKVETRWVADGLAGRVWTFHDISEERRLEEELRELASTDYLTGALNRRAFELGFRSELERARRHKIALCLVMIDLDHFKRVNDTHGHQAGDIVLKETTSRIAYALRDSDIFGRLGGEEFGILLPHTGLEHAVEVAERLRATIARDPIDVGGVSLVATASLGVTGYRPETDDLTAMIKRADAALYAAKAGGRDRVVCQG